MEKRMTFGELEKILGRELTLDEICEIGIAAIDGQSDEQIVQDLQARAAQQSSRAA